MFISASVELVQAEFKMLELYWRLRHMQRRHIFQFSKACNFQNYIYCSRKCAGLKPGWIGRVASGRASGRKPMPNRMCGWWKICCATLNRSSRKKKIHSRKCQFDHGLGFPRPLHVLITFWCTCEFCSVSKKFRVKYTHLGTCSKCLSPPPLLPYLLKHSARLM